MTTLHSRLSTVKSTNPYFAKDLLKAEKANKFIGRGSALSSTNKYMAAAGDLANCGVYAATDSVFVSAEGARGGRLAIDTEELARAVAAGATFVTDNSFARYRSYNRGEREVADFLTGHGYTDNGTGTWTKGK